MAKAYGKIESGVRVIGRWRDNVMHAKLAKCGPLTQGNVRIDQWSFDEVGQRVFLLLRQLRTNIRNHYVVAGEYAVVSVDAYPFSIASVGDFHLLLIPGVIGVLYAQNR